MSLERRRQLVDRDHPRLSVVRQCELVSINRSGLYPEPAGETALNLALMRLIDAQFMETPWYGSRQMVRHLRREGHGIGRKRVRRMMAVMGLVPIYQRLASHGRPEIFDSPCEGGGQGSQFTSPQFTKVLRDVGVRISMDGRSRWTDNVFIERLWRSPKYECVYLHALETGSELRGGLTQWVGYYNARRPHSSLDGRTPDEAYAASVASNGEKERLAA
jgi:hypothetical protein